jgi:hypothetical protein
VIVGYFLDGSESVDVEDECSSCLSGVGRIESSALSISSHSSSALRSVDSESNYYECSDNDDDLLVECFTCGSMFDLETFYFGC